MCGSQRHRAAEGDFVDGGVDQSRFTFTLNQRDEKTLLSPLLDDAVDALAQRGVHRERPSDQPYRRSDGNPPLAHFTTLAKAPSVDTITAVEIGAHSTVPPIGPARCSNSNTPPRWRSSGFVDHYQVIVDTNEVVKKHRRLRRHQQGHAVEPIFHHVLNGSDGKRRLLLPFSCVQQRQPRDGQRGL